MNTELYKEALSRAMEINTRDFKQFTKQATENQKELKLKSHFSDRVIDCIKALIELEKDFSLSEEYIW